MILNRKDGSVNFNKSWAQYKSGFGDQDGEFWIGLDKLHQITQRNQYRLKVVFRDFAGQDYQSYYSSFSVGPQSDGYRLSLSGFNSIISPGGDSLSFDSSRFNIHKMKFSTYDNDNDRWVDDNCAKRYNGGWWWNNCGLAHPTGSYLPGGKLDATGIIWCSAKDNNYSYKTMKFILIQVGKG